MHTIKLSEQAVAIYALWALLTAEALLPNEATPEGIKALIAGRTLASPLEFKHKQLPVLLEVAGL